VFSFLNRPRQPTLRALILQLQQQVQKMSDIVSGLQQADQNVITAVGNATAELVSLTQQVQSLAQQVGQGNLSQQEQQQVVAAIADLNTRAQNLNDAVQQAQNGSQTGGSNTGTTTMQTGGQAGVGVANQSAGISSTQGGLGTSGTIGATNATQPTPASGTTGAGPATGAAS
jgi:chromosome segregation ATPase